MNGPSWAYSGSFENFMVKLRQQGTNTSETHQRFYGSANNTLDAQVDDYWLPSLASLGKVGHIFAHHELPQTLILDSNLLPVRLTHFTEM
jgi:hypothetical protein